MNEKRMSLFDGSILWFGAAVSIAEIMTGALLAPLGLGVGLGAIVAGHAIGGVLFYLVGRIGSDSGKGAMESTAMAFGRYGSLFFSVLNILQLVGWTAVMIFSGAQAMGAATGKPSALLWSVLIGLLIALWIVAGLKRVRHLNGVAVVTLLILSLVLGYIVFRGGGAAAVAGGMGFGLALELSIAMPVSWLPLISDYTRHAGKGSGLSAVSAAAYFAGSVMMYAIGLGAALFSGTSDIVTLLGASGLGVAAMLIVILSTVTTTFLDVYSAAESLLNIRQGINPKLAGVAVCAAGVLLAATVPVMAFEGFLYLIGSVFVPMAVIMIVDYFVAGNRTAAPGLNWKNAVLWGVGFVAYRVLLNMDTALGSTVPVILILTALCVAANLTKRTVNNHARKAA